MPALDQLYQWLGQLMPSLGVGQSRATRAYTMFDPTMDPQDTGGYMMGSNLVRLNPAIRDDPSEVHQTMAHENIHTALDRMKPNWDKLQGPGIRDAMPMLMSELGGRGYDTAPQDWLDKLINAPNRMLNEGLAFAGSGEMGGVTMGDRRKAFVNEMLQQLRNQGKDTSLLEKIIGQYGDLPKTPPGSTGLNSGM